MKNRLQSLFGIVVIAGVLALIAGNMEYSRTPPGNLNVFVLANAYPPKEFYSSPHANQLLGQGASLARLPLEQARAIGIPMAEESKQDFLCWHGAITWWLIDHGLWASNCRWTDDGKWQ